MSRSPFIAGGSPRARAIARRRRQRRRGLKLLMVVILGSAVAAAVLIASRHHRRSAHTTRAPSPARVHRTKPAIAVVAARSPLGLVLGTPPLTLKLGAPDSFRMPFHHPPRSGLLFNLDTGRVLWRRDPLTRVPIASLTKMMTALLVVQRAASSDRVLITPQALAYQGSGIGLLPRGRHVPLEALLAGLLLPSGNDAAIALAQHVSGSVGRFVHLMNVQAARLGLGCTRYASPSGIIDQGNYSCAADLAVLAAVDLAQPRLARLTRAASVVVPFPIKGGKLYLYNNNPLVRLGYPGITGLKTGYTLASGVCLVETAERHGVRLGAIVLNSPDAANQASRLLDRGFESVYHQKPVPEPLIPSVPVVPARAPGH